VHVPTATPHPNFELYYTTTNTMPANTQESRIILAIEAVRSTKRMSLRAAAKTYGVPESSLRYRIKGRIEKHEKRNATHNLTESEEETLVRYIFDLDS
jgi:hypothetical protein